MAFVNFNVYRSERRSRFTNHINDHKNHCYYIAYAGLSLDHEKPQADTGREQDAMVGYWDRLGCNGSAAYVEPGKHKFIYLLPILIVYFVSNEPADFWPVHFSRKITAFCLFEENDDPGLILLNC